MRAITISVEYDDLLAITLPRAARHFERICVVSTPTDRATADVVAGVENAELFTTDVFYARGASFNKGAAIEQAFDVVGRSGWLCLFDADIVFPPAVLPQARLKIGKLHAPRRRLCLDPHEFHDDADWRQWPIFGDFEHAGYCQIFHADDPVLRTRPWHPTGWANASSDSWFQAKWSRHNKVWLPFDAWHVVHLGEPGRNWHGRCTRRLDGTLPQHAAERARAQEQMRELRRQHGYDKERLG